jgi:hypothetical protein
MVQHGKTFGTTATVESGARVGGQNLMKSRINGGNSVSNPYISHIASDHGEIGLNQMGKDSTWDEHGSGSGG